jgi:flagellar protein FlaJ
MTGTLGAIVGAYRVMDVPFRQYLLVFLLPAAGAFVLAVAGALALSFPLFVELPAVGLGALVFLAVLIYPKLERDRRRREIRQRFHLYLTHLTVLSMTNIDRVEMFRRLATVEEYESLADETAKLVAIVDTWNQSLEDACRFRAKRVPSPLLSDFFERLAYVVGGGQRISDFLVEERESMVQEFVIRYESDLSSLDVMKELYLSLMLSVAFILVFAVLLPILIGLPPTLVVGGVVGMFAVVQTAFVFAVHQVSPRDPLWYVAETEGRGPMAETRAALVVGVVGSLVATVGVGAVAVGALPVGDGIPTPVLAAVPFTPLLLPGLLVRREEKRIRTRDREFPSFVRALGSVESVKQSSTSNVLASLRNKDFGALTENVDSLYKRLNMRIDPMESWQLFAAETGSHLIHKFGDMYVTGREMGGDPQRLGGVISRNLNEVLKVREQRRQATSTMIGVIYGLTATTAFALFVGLEVVAVLIELTEQMQLSSSEVSFLFSTSMYHLPTIELLLVVVLVLNAAFSAVLVRVIDRASFRSGLVHFVLLTWTGALTAVLTRAVASNLINV